MNVLYFEEAVNVCDCCGKSDLKGTYAVNTPEGTSFFGSVCVLNNTGKTRRDITAETSKYREDNIKKAMQEYNRSGVGARLSVKIGQASSLGLKFKKRSDFLLDAFSEKQNIIDKLANIYKISHSELLSRIE